MAINLTFWQPNPSFHQEAFLNALSKEPWVESVELRYERDVSVERIEGGWPRPVWENIDARQIRSDEVPLDAPDRVHCFTGFYTHRLIWRIFNRLPDARNCRCLAYAECPALFGWHGLLRRLKYQFYAGLLARRLDGVLAVGQRGLDFYDSILKERVPVHYFTYYDCDEADFPTPESTVSAELVELLYVGRLIPLKGLDRLFKALAALTEGICPWRLTLLGNGPQQEALQKLANSLGIGACIRWRSAVAADKVARYYRNSHYLIQPSRGDGWGMTVPEALRHGCEVIVSEACGAADLARPHYRLPNHEAAWPGILEKALESGPPTIKQRQTNRSRAMAVSAQAGVKRFKEILEEYELVTE